MPPLSHVSTHTPGRNAIICQFLHHLSSTGDNRKVWGYLLFSSTRHLKLLPWVVALFDPSLEQPFVTHWAEWKSQKGNAYHRYKSSFCNKRPKSANLKNHNIPVQAKYLCLAGRQCGKQICCCFSNDRRLSGSSLETYLFLSPSHFALLACQISTVQKHKTFRIAVFHVQFFFLFGSQIQFLDSNSILL